ncbi:hypothetical protein CC2G_000913 [Coprinopsis cinerea AmutBmut pab1-1]|nr:hypothetical protein CC2G_000913 [Coprinopsis cinerea AmutBmut pab1-1]
MIDCGATGKFLDKPFVEKHRITAYPLRHPIRLLNIDGTPNQAGSITHFARLELTVDGYSEWTDFLITDLGGEDVILGLPWLRKINPQIDWQKGTLEIPPPRISSVTIEEVPDEDAQPPREEPPSGNAIIEQIYDNPDPPTPTVPDDPSIPDPSFEPSEPPLCRIRANRMTRRKWVRKGLIEDTGDELWCAAGFTYCYDFGQRGLIVANSRSGVLEFWSSGSKFWFWNQVQEACRYRRQRGSS